jgi:AcrB/AcrD/AcrF family
MISDFFIDRPVLANVLAILMVVIGAVAVFALPVAQYPDVVPPTVQVTTRYPGASARTVVDTVALPIEQQVNGVEGMIYMQSYSGADGSYSLTVTFKIGADLNRTGPGAEPGIERTVLAAAGGAGARRRRAEEFDGNPADRHVDVARLALRQPLPGQLRDHQA